MNPAAQLVGRQSGRGPITAALTRGSSTRQRATLVLPPTDASSANADASQYFSIETRLQLKARLTKLQLQLRQQLVQAKLAWMRCFAEPRTAVARAAALQMVQLGEGLTSSLSRAFDLAAGTATAPLSEYQALVTRVESEMVTFQNLITSMAHGSYSQAENQTEADGDEDADEEATTYPNRHVNFDLPSMQTYCKQVAPPYSSYLPNNAVKTRKKHIV